MTAAIADLPAPRAVPFAGNALQVRADRLHLVLERWARRHGPVFRFAIGRRTVVVFAESDPINAMLRERPDVYRRWSEIGDVFTEIGLDGVFSAEGDAWRRQRRLAVTALNSNHLQRYYEVIRLSTERLHERLARAAFNSEPFDLKRAFMAFTTDVTSSLAFGYDLNTLERESELQEHLERVLPLVSRRISAPFAYWRYVQPPADRAAARSLGAVRVAVAGFIGEARRRMEAQPGEPRNFLESMLAAQAEGRYSDDEVFGNAFTMLVAGEDTTAHSLGWAAWFMARDPALQARVAEEARTVLGDARVPRDSAAADALVYGDGVLREAIRLKSAAPLLFLEPLHDTTLAGVDLPRGTRVIGLSRYAEAEDAPELDPTRDGRRQLAFGAGPRFCPGRNLALLEARSALAMLARNFELALDPAAPPVRERFGFTMQPSELRVLLRERR